MLSARALSSESSFGGAADTFSNVASLGSSASTPPTTVADSISLASEASKPDNGIVIDTIEPAESSHVSERAEPLVLAAPVVAPPQEGVALGETPKKATPNPDSTTSTPASSRPRRDGVRAPVYNLSRLAGTDIHGKRRSKGDIVADRRRRSANFDALADDADGLGSTVSTPAGTPGRATKLTKKPRLSEKPRISTRSSGIETENPSVKVSALGKRSRKAFEKGAAKMSRELRRLQDTNEFAGIDLKPVMFTTWANGKWVNPAAQPAKKKAKLSEAPKKEDDKEAATAPVEDAPLVRKRRVKRWLDRGLYSGQDAPVDIHRGLTPGERKTLADLPELAPTSKANSVLPQPMFNGLRLLIRGRDFKLPFDICNPLPPSQPKPDTFRKITKNRFVGDSQAYWKKTPHFMDQSTCVCTPEDGCGESCQNRIMLYECDSGNCNVGEDLCQNRAFAKLAERIKEGGKYRVGVEVIKTDDRGHGIRTNRCFQANQIIMEYTGEIITEEECDRRMNEEYKNNQCYYLMSFDQNMIIDATTGSIARFVNHSCNPNCRMIKWIVSGQPRMALFAGDRPIMTGEELTYDYNFDPFSTKNVQKCLCGSANCRGVLGPKPKEVKIPKPPKADLKKGAKGGPKAGKRKLSEMMGDQHGKGGSMAKKRKVKTPTGVKAKAVKSSIAKTSVKAVKGAAKKTSTVVKKTSTVVKKSVSAISTKAALKAKTSGGRKVATIRKTNTVVKTYSKTKGAPRKTPAPGRKSLAAISASADNSRAKQAKKGSPPSVRGKKSSPASAKVKQAGPLSTKGKKPATPQSAKSKPGPKSAATSASPRKGLDLARPAKIQAVSPPTA